MRANNTSCQLADWYKKPAGKYLLQLENALLNKGLENIFGYHLMMMGALDYSDGLTTSPIAHKIIMHNQAVPGGALHLLGSQYDLPLRNGSVDVVVLPHLLEYSPYPHDILRECERVITPNGYMIVLGFNPLSCYGMCKLLPGLRRRMPWQGHFYRPARLRDWLKLLGMDVVDIQYCGFAPPLPRMAFTRRLRFMEKAQGSYLSPLGGVYMMVAHNQPVASHVVKFSWRRKRAHSNIDGVVEPTTRSRQYHNAENNNGV